MLRQLDPLFDEIADALGSEHVHRSGSPVERRARATFPESARVLGVVRPANVSEVSAVVRVCQRFSMPFYAISTGQNWGYGSAPVMDSLAIDLGRMNRIVEFNERLGYARIEPGVTLQQMYAFLQEQGGKFWMDSAGTRPDCSIVGNTLERGYGHTPYADHAALSCALEVVLPNGNVIETGLGALGKAAARHVYGPCLGPALGGLFYQSSLGIVTAMTVWFMPAPERFCAYFFGIGDGARFSDLIDALLPLRLAGVIRSAVHIGNAYRVLPAFTQCPLDRLDGGGALRGPLLAELKQRFGILEWHGNGGLYGSALQVREGKLRLRRALKGLAGRLTFLDDGRLSLLEHLRPLLRTFGAQRLDRQLDVLRPAFDLLKGVPTARFLPSVYWRKKHPAPPEPDPDRDRCGLMWCSVLSEFCGEQADSVQRIAADLLLKVGFEPGITAMISGDRSLEHTISIMYDRDVEGQDEFARITFESLLEALMRAGYYPYRLPTFAQGILERANPAYRALLANLKRTLDPQHLLAVGRYTVNAPAGPSDPI